MLSKITRAKNEKGFAWIELLVVIFIIVIIAFIAMPQFNQYKMIRHNSEAKANLNNLYLACKAYWADNAGSDACSVAIAKQTSYGYIQSENVEVTVTSGTDTETDFEATASHTGSSTTYTVDESGTIS